MIVRNVEPTYFISYYYFSTKVVLTPKGIWSYVYTKCWSWLIKCIDFVLKNVLSIKMFKLNIHINAKKKKTKIRASVEIE